MKTVHRPCVAALIVSKDNKIFFGKKHPDHGGVYVECWHIPGGGIDAGEVLEDALRREVKEETGIDISGYPITLVDDTGRGQSEKTNKQTGEKYLCEMTFNVFRVDIDKDAADIAVSLDDDLVEYQWLAKDQIGSIQHTPPSVELFKRLGW